MISISKLAGAITHPTRTLTSAAGTTLGVAAAGLRTVGGVAGWVLERTAGGSAQPSSPWTRAGADAGSVPVGDVPAVPVPEEPSEEESAPVTTGTRAARTPATKGGAARKAAPAKATARKTPSGKLPAKKAPAKRAPSKQAAVLAPALGLTEDEVEQVTKGSGSDKS